MSIVRFADIGTNTCSRAFQLIHKRIMTFDRFTQFDYLDSKIRYIGDV